MRRRVLCGCWARPHLFGGVFPIHFHIRTNGRKRLSAPAEDNKEETIELLREYGRRVYQNYKTGGERHCFMPSIIPLHKEMKELGCDQAACVPSPNRGPKKKQRSGRRR